MNKNIDIRYKKCKVEAFIKSLVMVVELKTSSAEKKLHIKIILKFGGHFVNSNNVDMSYLRCCCLFVNLSSCVRNATDNHADCV